MKAELFSSEGLTSAAFYRKMSTILLTPMVKSTNTCVSKAEACVKPVIYFTEEP